MPVGAACAHASAGGTSFSEPRSPCDCVTQKRQRLLSAGSIASRSRMDFGPWLGSPVVRALSHYAKVVQCLVRAQTRINH